MPDLTQLINNAWSSFTASSVGAWLGFQTVEASEVKRVLDLAMSRSPNGNPAVFDYEGIEVGLSKSGPGLAESHYYVKIEIRYEDELGPNNRPFLRDGDDPILFTFYFNRNGSCVGTYRTKYPNDPYHEVINQGARLSPDYAYGRLLEVLQQGTITDRYKIDNDLNKPF